MGWACAPNTIIVLCTRTTLAWGQDLHSVTTTFQSTVQNPLLTNPKEFDSDSNRVS